MPQVQPDLRTPSAPLKGQAVFDDALSKAKVRLTGNTGNPEAKTGDDGGGKQVGPQVKAPTFGEYKSIEKSKDGKDTLTFTTRDGQTTVVDRQKTPELYAQVLKDKLTLDAQADGFTLSVDNSDMLWYADHITGIDTRHADKGVITYTFGANKSVINDTLTPDTFKRLQQAKQALAYKDQGYALVGGDQQLPLSSSEYKHIKHLDNGLTLVETKDGKRYVIGSEFNPELSQQLGYQSAVQKVIDQGKAEGYELVSSLPSDFDVTKITVESIDKDTGVIQFQYDGQKYLLPPGDAQEAESNLPPGIRIGKGGANDKSPSLELRGTRLYELLSALKATEGTMANQALVNAIKNHDELAKDNAPTVSLSEIDNIHAYQEGGVQVVTLKSGRTITVIQALAPESFKAYAETAKALEGIKRAEGDGYRLAGKDEYLPSTDDISGMGAVGDYGPGLIAFTYQKPGGQQEKIIVSQDLNPEMFAQVAGHRGEIAAQVSDVDALRAKHGLPPASELDYNNLPTTEMDEEGQPLGVQDLMLRDLVKEYRDGVANGSITADDPRAKFLRAIEAKSMAENGMQIIPEHGIRRNADEPIEVTDRDVREQIFDLKAIDQQLLELSGNETIANDMQRLQKNAQAKVQGGEGKITEAQEKLKTMANSQGFREYIKELKDAGNLELAQQEIQQTYLALAQVDPKVAEQFLGDLTRDTLIMDLDGIMADPSKISPENSALAATDTTKYWLRAARAFSDIPNHSINIWETTIEKVYNNKPDAAAFGNIYADLGDKYFRNGSISQADIDAAFAKEQNAFRALSTTEREGLVKLFTTMKDTGTFGSMSGIFGLARGVYQLHGDPAKMASTAEGRLAISADFVTFASFSNGFVTLGAKTYDHIFKTKIYDHLGLSKTIPDMWRKPPPTTQLPQELETDFSRRLAQQDFLPDKPDVYVPDGKGGFRVQPGGANSGGAWVPDANGGNATRGGPNFNPEAFKAGYLDGKYNTNYRIQGANTGHRIAGSVSRFLGSAGDLVGGVTGIVLGGFSIRDGLKNHDSIQTASGFLSVFGGAGSTVAGLASVNGAWGIIGGTAGRLLGAAGPVGFLVGAVLGFVGAILSIDRTKKLHKISMQNWDNIKAFEQQGLLKPGGAENYVWLQTYLSDWGQRDAPADQSIFDFRKDEFDNRQHRTGRDQWGPGNHKDYEGDGKNRVTKDMERSDRDH
ncbi:hypothetical protein ACQKPE_11745 [Pseudomonas sp. NPDC089554]|uniref:hypothetical protein n=1 Tax=Pseudomonas sp. NPDC089554 TaxID=3390653 RepID=UPI003D074486